MVNQFEQKLKCLFFHQMQVQKPKDMKKFTHTLTHFIKQQM